MCDREFVTGFRKRRQQRQAVGAALQAKRERQAKLTARKEVTAIDGVALRLAHLCSSR
jgi:hypothetical protein